MRVTVFITFIRLRSRELSRRESALSPCILLHFERRFASTGKHATASNQRISLIHKPTCATALQHGMSVKAGVTYNRTRENKSRGAFPHRKFTLGFRREERRSARSSVHGGCSRFISSIAAIRTIPLIGASAPGTLP